MAFPASRRTVRNSLFSRQTQSDVGHGSPKESLKEGSSSETQKGPQWASHNSVIFGSSKQKPATFDGFLQRVCGNDASETTHIGNPLEENVDSSGSALHGARSENRAGLARPGGMLGMVQSGKGGSPKLTDGSVEYAIEPDSISGFDIRKDSIILNRPSNLSDSALHERGSPQKPMSKSEPFSGDVASPTGSGGALRAEQQSKHPSNRQLDLSTGDRLGSCRRFQKDGEWEARGGLVAVLWDPEPREGREVLLEREREALLVAEKEAERRKERGELIMSSLESHPLATRLTDLQITRLVDELRSEDSSKRKDAVHQLRMLAKYSEENRGLIADVGGIEPLGKLLSDSDDSIVSEVVTALLNLSIHSGNKKIMHGVIEPLVKMLEHKSWDTNENAAATLFSLSVLDEYKIKIGASGAIPFLTDILRKGSEQGQRDACKALFNLSILSTNKWRLVEAGAVEVLVNLLQEPASGMAEKAVSVLANLATIPEGREALADAFDGISGLVEVVESGLPRGKENAAAALWHLAKNDPTHRKLILQEVVIPPLVALAQTGTSRAKEKANLLLTDFRDKCA